MNIHKCTMGIIHTESFVVAQKSHKRGNFVCSDLEIQANNTSITNQLSLRLRSAMASRKVHYCTEVLHWVRCTF